MLLLYFYYVTIILLLCYYYVTIILLLCYYYIATKLFHVKITQEEYIICYYLN